MTLKQLSALLTIAAAFLAFGAANPTLAQSNYPGDVDGDGDVDLSDLAGLLSSYLNCIGDPLYNANADIDEDGCVDLSDLATLLANYGTIAPPANMVFVEQGEFQMGDPWGEGDSDELPVHAAFVDSFYVGIHEVTHLRYCDYLNAAYGEGLIDNPDSHGGVVHKAGGDVPYCDTAVSSSWSKITWDGTSFSVVAGQEDHPMREVSWYGAVAFCNWLSATEGRPLCYDLSTWTCDFGVAGYRLPTEAEWEKAAAWDAAQQRHYRFGEHTDGCGPICLDGERANYIGSGDPYDNESTPVGYYDGTSHDDYQTQDAHSYYGCYDMSGNVWEWCNDWYDETYYSVAAYDNPTGPDVGDLRVHRGAGWGASAGGCRSAKRSWFAPDYRGQGGGFRLALR